MLQNFISSSIRAELPFEPTEQQVELLDALGGFLMSDESENAVFAAWLMRERGKSRW